MAGRAVVVVEKPVDRVFPGDAGSSGTEDH